MFVEQVDVGDFLRLTSCVLYTELENPEQPLINIEVVAHVARPELRSSEVSPCSLKKGSPFKTIHTLYCLSIACWCFTFIFPVHLTACSLFAIVTWNRYQIHFTSLSLYVQRQKPRRMDLGYAMWFQQQRRKHAESWNAWMQRPYIRATVFANKICLNHLRETEILISNNLHTKSTHHLPHSPQKRSLYLLSVGIT